MGMNKVKIRRAKLFFIAFVLMLVVGSTVALAATKGDDVKSLGLFNHVSDEADLEPYANNVNHISSENTTDFIKQTIFTDHNVYAMIGIKASEMSKNSEINQTARITYNDVDQTLYDLVGRLKEIDEINGVRYFFYTGKITPTRLSPQNGVYTIPDRDPFYKFNSLRDSAGELLELNIALDHNEYSLTTPIENVYTTDLTFQPDLTQYNGDFYDSVVLTPYELKLKGTSKSLLSVEEEEWEQPHFALTIVRTNKPDINLSYDTRGMIADEGYLLGLSRGHSSDTGEFYHYWDFHEWELNLEDVTALIIDGETYKVNKK